MQIVNSIILHSMRILEILFQATSEIFSPVYTRMSNSNILAEWVVVTIIM